MTLPYHGYPDWQGSLQTADRQDVVAQQVINPGQLAFGSIVDFRTYNSFYLYAAAFVNGVATGFGNFRFVINWWNDLLGTLAIYRDDHAVFPFYAIGGPIDVPNGEAYIQGQVHGPFAQLILCNSGPDPITATGQLYGNSRSLPGEFVREASQHGSPGLFTTDTHLISEGAALGAGANISRVLRMTPGPVRVRMAATGAAMSYVFFNPFAEEIDGFDVPAGTVKQDTIIFPCTSVRLRVANTAGVGGTYDVHVTGTRQPM